MYTIHHIKNQESYSMTAERDSVDVNTEMKQFVGMSDQDIYSIREYFHK